jgi:uncharacterized membrane protein
MKLIVGGNASEWMLRVPSVLFDSAAGGVVALIAARLAGWRCAVPAILLYATFPILIMYAQEARPYAAQLLFTTLAMYGQIMVLRGEGSLRGNFALATIASLGAILVIPAGAVIVIVQQLALLWVGTWPRDSEARKQLVWHLAATWILGGLALLLLLPSVLQVAAAKEGLLRWHAYTPYLERIKQVIDGSYGLVVPADVNVWLRGRRNPQLMVGLFALMAIGLLAHRRSPAQRYFAFMVVGSLVALAVMASFTAVAQRYVIGMIPAAVLLAGSGAAALLLPSRLRWVFAPAIALVGAGFVLQALDTLQSPRKIDWRPIIAFLRDQGVRDQTVFSDQLEIRYAFRRYGDAADALAFNVAIKDIDPIQTLWSAAAERPVAWFVLDAGSAKPPRPAPSSALCSWPVGNYQVVMLARDASAVPAALRVALDGPECAVPVSAANS